MSLLPRKCAGHHSVTASRGWQRERQREREVLHCGIRV